MKAFTKYYQFWKVQILIKYVKEFVKDKVLYVLAEKKHFAEYRGRSYLSWKYSQGQTFDINCRPPPIPVVNTTDDNHLSFPDK